MKIVFVTFGNFDGHATLKRATGMAEPLINEGHEVHLLLESCETNVAKAILECPNATVHWHRRTTSPWEERRQKQAAVDAIKPDVVWVCGVGLRNWIRRSSKDTFMVADHSELYSAMSLSGLRNLFYRLTEWGCCLTFDGHICASRYLERFYQKRLTILGCSPTRVHYSPYAYHPAVIRVDHANADTLRTRFPGKKLLLYIGSFWENYGFWDILKALREVAKSRSDFVAILAGRGPEKDRGITWTKQHKLESVICIQGYIPEESISGYFTAAHAFLCPLRDTVQDWARCPSKLFLYVPFNRPVVTCAVGEARELFKESGAYYSPGNVPSLASAIARVLSNDTPTLAVDPINHTYEARVQAFIHWMARLTDSSHRQTDSA